MTGYGFAFEVELTSCPEFQSAATDGIFMGFALLLLQLSYWSGAGLQSHCVIVMSRLVIPIRSQYQISYLDFLPECFRDRHQSSAIMHSCGVFMA